MSNLYNILTKHGTAVAFGLGILGVLIFYIPVMGGLEEFLAVPEDERASSEQGDIFLTGMHFTRILIILAIAAIAFFGIYHIVTNPKGALKGIIGVVAIAVIFAICYSMADSAIAPKYNHEDFNHADAGVSKYVGGALMTMIVLSAIAFFGLLLSELRNFFK